MIKVLNFRDKPLDDCCVVIDTTSRSLNWSKGLSPFFLGPCEFGGLKSKNVENFWQFSKVYKNHVDQNKNPTPEYFSWRDVGFANDYAIRYPMGKGAKPLYSYFQNQKLDYILARKQIYIPLYQQEISKTEAWDRLSQVYEKNKNLVLLDFDAYEHRKLGFSWNDVIHCETRKMGHAFVLAMMLEKYL